MHSLWSRAAQAQNSCRCRLCHHSAHITVRRSTNAAPRRRVSPADLFTACYTTILGAATVFDSKRKEDRRHELDERLEKARNALGKLGVQESSDRQDDRPRQHDSHGVGVLNAITSSSAHALPQELVALCNIAHRPLLYSSWLQTQLEWVQIEAAIVAEEQDLEYIHREPRSDRHLEMTTSTVIGLVNQLIWRNQTNESTRSQDNLEINGTPTVVDEFLNELRDTLRTSHYPSYHQPYADVDDTAKNRLLLGESIRRIFNQATSSSEIVAKISYNLLTSSAPPSIHTYNTLIAGFNRIQRPDLAQAVIDSYIHRTTWPATQQTIVCLLNHYRGTGQVEGHRDIIQRMRGVKDDGLHYRIIDKKAIYTQEWLKWATENCASRRHAFVERAQRDDAVFNSLIKGYLHRGELRNASMALVACVRVGGFVPVQTLQDLFSACLATVDYAAIRKLVRGFVKNMLKFMAIVKRIVNEEPVAASRQVVISVSRLLDICWFPDIDIFGPVTGTYARTQHRLRSILTRVQFELEIRETAALYRATLKEIHSTDLLISRLERTTAALESAQRSRRKIMEPLTNFSKMAKILSIDERCRDMEPKIKSITSIINTSIIKYKTLYDFDPTGLVANKRPWDLSYPQQVRRKSIINALQRIQIYKGHMTQGDIKLQLLQNLPDQGLARRLENSGGAENLTIFTLTTFYAPKLGTSRRLRDHNYSKSIRQLEQELTDTVDTAKAILFARLIGGFQSKLRYRHPDWNKMPLEKLVEYHMRYGICKVRKTKQTEGVGSRDQQNPAIRTSQDPSMVLEDADDANTIVPRGHALGVDEGLNSSEPITKPRSMGPSALRDEDSPSPVAALG
ncbi:uncharacterized protein GGS22DRAFT_169973 [Annulohypoxylon maeteangense]|uniref:uncharacterized protein n=1 Tax=Annulohypoxylon maeteangense TaxID=1927788 RepID=UPI00200884A4|nr:uncharacterized protein GGS22DRAFT_169973 [Annulohypoxylon maeteangense]KAI0882644.1 hypothetical protein GGS22DRAFT_169973 [Annulohypoxylon maeteangense]